ncbi:UNVERIFIED_CONTAM: Mechanosensitive ion channel protein 2, chloroplastic [Sesamum angustifolium]|uniref:Mechanosensitive ion channel protein 2, chloroplastic n=1 Tax=Sesamum angustifolium TaxID=2727405 RepID=A0AAW2NHT0_9LAMI
MGQIRVKVKLDQHVQVREKSKATVKSTSDNKVDAKGETTLNSDSKSRATDHMPKEMQTSDAKADSQFGQTPKVETKEDPKIAAKIPSDLKLNNSTKPVSRTDTKSLEETSSNTNNSSGPTHNTSTKKQPQKVGQGTSVSASELGPRRSDNVSSALHSKQDIKQPAPQMPASKPSLEENIVLGVALEGSKRTLPIEEEAVPPSNPEDVKELAALRSGNGPGVAEKDKNDNKKPNIPTSPGNDQLDQQD